MPAGRPLKFETPAILEAKISAYFDYCDAYEEKIAHYSPTGEFTRYDLIKKPKKYTVAGLARWLDCDRRTITEYEDRDEFFPTIRRAKARIEEQLEECLYGNNVTGIIFNLKNNYGWKDKSEQELYGKDGKDLLPQPIMDVSKDNSNNQDSQSIQKD